MTNVKGMLVLATIVLGACVSAKAKDAQMVVSSASIKPVECDVDRPAVLGPVSTAIASKAVGAAISFIAEWFSSIEERQKAQDVATAHGGIFYCLADGKAGEIAYRRQASSHSSGANSESAYVGIPDMLFNGELRAIEATAEDSTKVYKVWFEPRELALNSFMGKARGKIDLAITITLEIPSLVIDKKSKSVSTTTHTLDPILFRGIAEGTRFNLTSDMSLATGAVTFVKSDGLHPVSVKIVVDEVPAGAGSKLIASIYKAVGEGIKEQNEALTAKIIASVFGADDDPE